MGRKRHGPPLRFKAREAAKNSASNAAMGTAGSGLAIYATTEPVMGTIILALTFVGTMTVGFGGEYLKHRADDPLPVFDGPTTFLFDTVVVIVGFLLFVIPAMRLDLALAPQSSLPGIFGFAALGLTVFLAPLLRGLLCNLGVVREADDEDVSV